MEEHGSAQQSRRGHDPMRARHCLERMCAVELPHGKQIERIDECPPTRECGPILRPGRAIDDVRNDCRAQSPERPGEPDIRLGPFAMDPLSSTNEGSEAWDE